MSRSIRLRDFEPDTDSLCREIIEGLQSPVKELPCKLFYDERGSRLFEEICGLDEYYPTRTETVIMQTYISEIAPLIGSKSMLIEYGSGNSEKTRILLDHLPDLTAYVPIDISKEHLARSAASIAAAYPGLDVIPVCADYNDDLELPSYNRPISHRVVYFPGSTIGNFHHGEAEEFLVKIARVCGANGGLLIGVDLKKDPDILNRAYNDREGVTAAFNLNILARVNRELGANFQLDRFRHHAFYNEKMGRIEMHLVSMTDQTVRVCGIEIHFKTGESIWTESSYKYSLEEFADLAAKAGFKVRNVWTDDARLFSVQYLTTD
jgi:dimethylhistidine N-methyltransferase